METPHLQLQFTFHFAFIPLSPILLQSFSINVTLPTNNNLNNFDSTARTEINFCLFNERSAFTDSNMHNHLFYDYTGIEDYITINRKKIHSFPTLFEKKKKTPPQTMLS